MRRIYESSALSRDNDDPFSPRDDKDDENRSINPVAASHALLPKAIRRRAVDVSVTTDRTEYASGDPVAFRVTFRNRLPIPVSIPVSSPVPWHWAVDDRISARFTRPDEPDDGSLFTFGRSERKTFTRTWSQSWQVGERRWEPVETGGYEISVAVNTAIGGEQFLADTTRIEIR
ncbi:MAG: hypothetical protein ACOCPZ_01895 [Natrialbaceae archaeon]